jgi:1-deoxy-D-xylulose-5-phosphate reductoisomerase
MGADLKRVAVLGSTGSIGRQTLDVIAALPDLYEVIALAAGQNVGLLREQIARFRPRYAHSEPCLATDLLRTDLPGLGCTALEPREIAVREDVDVVVIGTAGAAGLAPTIAALELGKPVAIANKEVLVMAGRLVREAMLRGGGELRPVDSEHSAIWQCLWGEQPEAIARIILTASGGAFRDRSVEELAAVTPEEAVHHPNWNMGRKITVDSATLMNKGMETIEAMWLFGVSMDQVEVVLHRESIVHSLVEFCDGSVKAQLGVPDMRLPIQCALGYPDRLPRRALAPLDLAAVGTLNFGTPDMERFPCLRLCMEAGRLGRTYPAVLAAADEVAVELFLDRRIGFLDLPRVVEDALGAHSPATDINLGDILEADAWARRFATDWVRAGV